MTLSSKSTLAPLLSVVLALFCVTPPLLAAEPAPTAPAAAAATSPIPGQPNAQSPASGARRGSLGFGAPITAEEQAAIAKLAELPAWKAGVSAGDYSLAPPFAPAPENTPRDNVPKGKVATFHLDLRESKFYPPSAGRGGNSTNREVVVYIPAQSR